MFNGDENKVHPPQQKLQRTNNKTLNRNGVASNTGLRRLEPRRRPNHRRQRRLQVHQPLILQPRFSYILSRYTTQFTCAQGSFTPGGSRPPPGHWRRWHRQCVLRAHCRPLHHQLLCQLRCGNQPLMLSPNSSTTPSSIRRLQSIGVEKRTQIRTEFTPSLSRQQDHTSVRKQRQVYRGGQGLAVRPRLQQLAIQARFPPLPTLPPPCSSRHALAA